MSIHEILRQYWGHDRFRPLQQEIIEAVLAGNDVLALLPTGGGKSVCFQVPAMAGAGMCLVISPLIALMKDQVETLQRNGISAAAIYSGMPQAEINLVLNNCVHGAVKFLYLSPERLGSNLLLDYLPQFRINLLAVDEAHCISQWGFDFRPEYRKIAAARLLLPGTPVLALTASATANVVNDIQEQLGFKKKKVFRKSFERLNLHYVVRQTERKLDQMLHIFGRTRGSGLVYVRNRRKTEELAEFLSKHGIAASHYHGGLSNDTRVERQELWIRNKLRVLVCTNAFGMGIDKPDCTTVVHYEMPDCLEAYYQEAGRAGRNGEKAFCVLLFHASDELEMRQRIEQNFPPEERIRRVYEALGTYYQVPVDTLPGQAFAFDLAEFSAHFKLSPVLVFASLKLLSQCGFIHFSEAFYSPSQLQIVYRQYNLETFQQANPMHDEVLKMILRSYGGIFDHPVVINENFLAMKLNISAGDLRARLNKLKELGVIDYRPQTESAWLTYTGKRLDKKYLQLDPAVVANRKNQFVEKLESMIHYAKDDKLCRSRKILHYFDEPAALDCGTCDTCLERRRKLMNHDQFGQIEAEIKTCCLRSAMDIRSLCAALKQFREDDVVGISRILLDKGILRLDKQQHLFWQAESK